MSNRVPEIDGLRAIAMTMVIGQHSGLLPFGWVGVWLFYVISGYVITRGFIIEDNNYNSVPIRYLNFISRRFFRIVPIYLLYIFIVYCVLFLQNQPLDFKDLPYLLTFTYNWQLIFGYVPGDDTKWGYFMHLWTLSVEEQFYLFFPLIALFSPSKFRLTMIVYFIVLGPIIRFAYRENVAVIYDNADWSTFSIYASSICHFDAFLSGSLVANLEPYIRRKPKVVKLFWVGAMMSGTLYVTVYFCINRSLGATGIDAFRGIFSGTIYGQYREIFVYMVVEIFVSALLMQVILQRNFTDFLSIRLLTKIGAMSYGAYLFHIFFIYQIEFFTGLTISENTIPQRITIYLIVWILTVSLAYISYRWFETPISKWARTRFIGKAVHNSYRFR
jgi:peptidoglycan/LPS O-acetylase OafA/YrhL